MNLQLSREITHLHGEIEFLRHQNDILLDKIINRPRAPLSAVDYNPIGGYVSLKDKIAEAEEKSRKEAEADNAG